jgi:protein-S-isoprenylcysteine O-methyltransferase Ste14
VEDIADFWCQDHVGKPLREWRGISSRQGVAMHNAPPDTAQVIVLPPLIYGAAFVVGLLLHLVLPVRGLPYPLAHGIGVVCVFVSLPLAITTLRVLSRAHTPVDPLKPTTALVTEGPFRYSRNPLYVALTLLYLGVAFLVNVLWILLLVVPALVVLRYGVIAREEAYLARKFGTAYHYYTTQVRRWL